MQLSASKFKSSFSAALAAGANAIDSVMEHYLWAQKNIGELKKLKQPIDLPYIEDKISLTFNIQPRAYLHVAAKMGGGESKQAVATGRKRIRSLGISECYRASQRLSTDNFAKVLSKVEQFKGPADLHAAVDEAHREVSEAGRTLNEQKAKASIPDVEEARHCAGCRNLRSQLIALQKSHDILKAKYHKLQQRLSKIDAILK